MKRIFLRTSIVLVGMIGWFLPNRADATECSGGPLPDGRMLTWTCANHCYGPYIHYYEDDEGDTWWVAYYGCI